MLGDEKIREPLQATSELKAPLTRSEFFGRIIFRGFFHFVSRIFFVKVKSFTYVLKGIILWQKKKKMLHGWSAKHKISAGRQKYNAEGQRTGGSQRPGDQGPGGKVIGGGQRPEPLWLA